MDAYIKTKTKPKIDRERRCGYKDLHNTKIKGRGETVW